MPSAASKRDIGFGQADCRLWAGRLPALGRLTTGRPSDLSRVPRLLWTAANSAVKQRYCFPSPSRLPALAGFSPALRHGDTLPSAHAVELPKGLIVFSHSSVPQAPDHLPLSRTFPCSRTCSSGGWLII